MFLIARLPYGLASRMGGWFGVLVFKLARGERRKTLNSIRTAFPKELNEEQAYQLALNNWENVGRGLFQLIHWSGWTKEEIAAQVARVSGLENADRALARGKGLFVVTAHLGNWELLGGYLGRIYRGTAVAQKLYDPRFDEILNRFRLEKLGAPPLIKPGLALRGVLEALRGNQAVLAHCDLDARQDGVFVPFFGKLAWTQSGVARIAQKTGAAIVPAFLVWGADGQYELHMEKEVEVPDTGDKEKDIWETVRRYTGVIETYVKAYPDQWTWMHERWKTRPKEESGSKFEDELD
jgi:Kdo2-lipid IVA lauroyltransferase/acyltransferase